MPWNKDGSRKAFYKKSYKKSGFKMKKPSSFKLNNDKDKPSHDEEKYPTEKYTGPTGKGGKMLTNLFNKRAETVSKQIKQLEKMLKKGGYTFKRSPKSKGRGNL